MATYKMLKTHRGVRVGEVHPVVFREGKTYELDDDLAAQLQDLEIAEPSRGEPCEPLVEDAGAELHENWLDTDPAVLRHGELTAAEVVARDRSDNPQTSRPAVQEEGKAEGEDTSDEDGKPAKSKKSADKAK